MKILRSLNKDFFLFILLFFFLQTLKTYSTEPVDIWNIEVPKPEAQENIIEKNEEENSIKKSIYEMQEQKNNNSIIEQDETLLSKEDQIVGLYDPADNGLVIDMWLNSNGIEIIELFNKIKKIKLSNDAKEILNILFLTNTYYPNKNISSEEFLKLKSEWLIINNDLELIEEYIIKNQNTGVEERLIKLLVDHHLSNSDIEKSCEIFSKINKIFIDDYLYKFNIYCLINDEQREQAQVLFDIKKEFGFNDIFFEKKYNFLMEFALDINQDISEKSILDFHLSHRTNPDFKFEPTETTSKIIWSYLSSSNLLDSIENIDLEDINKISLIEKATHEGNYTEKDLFNLYKRFQFNINQLLTIKDSYKLLTNIEARALVYQGILITSESNKKIELVKILKDSFINENISKAFNNELIEILKNMSIEDIPSDYTSFYSKFITTENENLKRIKINNKVLHQSKLINYFKKNSNKNKIEKDLNDLLKKIKKDKSYSISTKDIIMMESLKSDGIAISKKYEDIYVADDSNMPIDIQVLINNEEMGLALLRLVEVIGQDELENIGPQSLYFIINTLNQLNIDPLRNKILLKVLPLKV
tara:strand:- start:914 stop:2677 length:1764 start_codon:yes stop_codon:yes gene_type:complete